MKLKPGQFYGETSHSLSANGFRFTEKSYSSSARLPIHSHELSHFCLVLAGNYNESISSRSFERGPSALVFYPPDVSHAEEHLTSGRHFLVEIDSGVLDRLRDYGAHLDEPAMLHFEASLWLAARMYREFIERDNLTALALESVSNELLITAARFGRPTIDRKPPRWLKKVKEYLVENSTDAPGLAELAAAVGVHPTHLARVFRRFEHCTAGDFLRRVRIEKARKRMISTDEPLVDIALKTGFADQAHFTRSFKRLAGMTPDKFRHVFASR